MNTRFLTEADRKEGLLQTLKNNEVSLDIFPYEWLCSTDFFRAPASIQFHAAYPGGLFDHSVNVLMQLLDMRNKGVTRPWSRPESPFIVGLLHDATKIDLYIRSQDMNPWTQELDVFYIHNPEAQNFGVHGYDSLCKVEQHMTLTPEEAACIRWHMGAYEGPDIWDAYDKSIKEFPNVLWTHTADMVASKLMEG